MKVTGFDAITLTTPTTLTERRKSTAAVTWTRAESRGILEQSPAEPDLGYDPDASEGKQNK